MPSKSTYSEQETFLYGLELEEGETVHQASSTYARVQAVDANTVAQITSIGQRRLSQHSIEGVGEHDQCQFRLSIGVIDRVQLVRIEVL